MAKKKITDSSVLGIIYTFVLALIIVVFVAITINTFYPAPVYPTLESTEKVQDSGPVREPMELESENQIKERTYQDERKTWAQNVSIIVISAATALVALGLFLAGKMPVLPNGILMGGLFTIFYGVTTALASESRYLIFGVVTASLIIIAAAGYLKFVHGVEEELL